MPLFVPILRLVMLFLNVYDSYKTLKPPPFSVRNPGQPSMRAVSQRKRDMKGCLAVWIVWCCYTTYERLVESIVSLFIPFYDEFKAMALLFLILTRARGAEPIFLHIIRPLLKPYTSTLDPTFELLRMIGDFVFALSLFPFRLAIEQWHKKFDHLDNPLDSELESSTDMTNLQSRRPPLSTAGPNGLAFPRKSGSDQGMVPSDSSNPSYSFSGQATEAANDQKHRIWYPPPSSYTALEDESTPYINSPNFDISVTDIQEQLQSEEWRQYPPFPSAYPPTPLTTNSRLRISVHQATTNLYGPSLDPAIYPHIPEDATLLDFRESLLPLRKPLDPCFVGDLSDKIGLTGDPSTVRHDTPMVIEDNDSSMNGDEEDEFDITLRTPLHYPGSSNRRPFIRPPIPSFTSIASKSTTLNTGGGSSLRTCSSTDSESSMSISKGSNFLRGKKRLHPDHKAAGMKKRIYLSEEIQSKNTLEVRVVTKPLVVQKKVSTKRPRVPQLSVEDTIRNRTDTGEGRSSSSESGYVDKENDGDKIRPDTRRRKIAIRPRVTRHATPPFKLYQSRTSIATRKPVRTSARLRANAAASVITESKLGSQTVSSSASDGGPSL